MIVVVCIRCGAETDAGLDACSCARERSQLLEVVELARAASPGRITARVMARVSRVVRGQA